MPTAQSRKRRRSPVRPRKERTSLHHHRVYVVKLDDPLGADRECYYVGMTGLDPDERFDNHKRGHKASGIVRRYGVALAYEWFEGIPAMPYEEAALAEPSLADDLRDLGFVVYGPTNRKRRPGRPLR